MYTFIKNNDNTLDDLIEFLNGINVSIKCETITLHDYTYNLIICEYHNLIIIYTNKWNETIKYNLIHLKLYFLKNSIDSIYINNNLIFYKLDVIQSKIKSIFKLNKRIHARKTKIITLNYNQVSEFVTKNCLFNPCSAKYKIGLIHNKQLVMVALFSKKRNVNRLNSIYKSYELIKIISLKDTNVVGGINKIINYFIKLYNPDDIMTYIDLNWYRSNSFSKLNFELAGITCTKLTSSSHKDKITDLRDINSGSLKLIKYLKPAL
ncbi:MAG: hypothetical protein ACQPRH_04960 [Solitalea-like symbiont of Tyrophagus putrescentiae]